MQQLFRHEALPYDGPELFVPTSARAVRDGLDNDERTIVLASAPKLDQLRESLGHDADDVTFVATDEHGRNPSRVTTLLHTFQTGADGRHSLGINDTGAPGRNAAVRLETRFSDCVLNVEALRSWPFSVVCLFDEGDLDDDGARAMRQDHSVVRGADTNPDFDPDIASRLWAEPVAAAPARAARTTVDRLELGPVRAFVAAHAAAFVASGDRVDDLVLAANEVVTNSLRHGGGVARVAIWFEDGSVVCEVRDAGVIDDPLIGRFAPPAAATTGRGIWLVNHLCDLVQLRSSPAGTVVRMYLDR